VTTTRGESRPAEAELAAARERLAAVRARIERAAARAGRRAADVTLVGVAKRQPPERILATIAAGVHVLGGSYVQEMRRVRPAIESAMALDPVLGGTPLTWRLVGRLQRNKVGLALRLFDTVDSVDRPELVDALARRAAETGRRLEVLLQVSLCGEPQKGGCEPEELEPLVRRVLAAESLQLGGLMTVPAASDDPEAARPVFRRLRSLRDGLAAIRPELARASLSMGMSGDLEVAVEEGATLVRIGTALFVERADTGSAGDAREDGTKETDA